MGPTSGRPEHPSTYSRTSLLKEVTFPCRTLMLSMVLGLGTSVVRVLTEATSRLEHTSLEPKLSACVSDWAAFLLRFFCVDTFSHFAVSAGSVTPVTLLPMRWGAFTPLSGSALCVLDDLMMSPSPLLLHSMLTASPKWTFLAVVRRDWVRRVWPLHVFVLGRFRHSPNLLL